MLTAGLLSLRDRKLLLAYSKNKQAFYLPGGKTNAGETSQAALIREIREELNISLGPAELQFYTHISAPAFGEQDGTIMEQDCFIQHVEQIPEPGAEIESIRYFDTRSYQLEPAQVPGVILLMQKLKQDGLID
jgi:8-oxo-dGTP pyrophosphatase MutT (NUDIX family)